MGLAECEAAAVLADLKHLDPYPGKKYSRETPIYVEPDVVVIREGDRYLATVNDEGLPKLRISRAYLSMFRNPGVMGDKETSTYVEKKLHSAFWLLRSVEQRRRTLQRVAQAIIDVQKEFLDSGPERLKPLLLKDVAQQVAVHESTVSRVVANKYMQTPRGLFPMRYFFLSGIKSPSGEGYTLDKVKGLIADIIQGEVPGHPLSDAKIAQLLVQRHRLPVARRTVAKYREELGFPASQDRKEKR
jgi:RNA polymerase sigma-54 factor